MLTPRPGLPCPRSRDDSHLGTEPRALKAWEMLGVELPPPPRMGVVSGDIVELSLFPLSAPVTQQRHRAFLVKIHPVGSTLPKLEGACFYFHL